MPFPSDIDPDTEVLALVEREYERQPTGVQLIDSENFTSPAVMRATGSVLTNKYSEGYPRRRYYGGNMVVDDIEQLAIDRAKESGSWEFLDDVEAMVMPDDLADALEEPDGARAAYENFSNTKKQGILLWVKQAKRDATRADRIAKVAQAASQGQTPLEYL